VEKPTQDINSRLFLMDKKGFKRHHEVKEEVPDDGVWLLLQLLHQPLQKHLLPARYIMKGGHQGAQQQVGTKNRFATSQ
jgi:hypothetical protein